VLHVHSRISHFGNTSFTFEFAIFKQPSDDLITTGQIAVVAIDTKTEKPIRVPDQLREAVARYEGLPNVV
jgi:acyl-CoA thioester hydrolase